MHDGIGLLKIIVQWLDCIAHIYTYGLQTLVDCQMLHIHVEYHCMFLI
jgi:hypothetical protein